MINEEAGVVSSTQGFSALGISRETLADLIADVRTERDRLVKRLVRGGVSSYPAGFARLNEQPLLHLLVVVDEPVALPREVAEAPASAAPAVTLRPADEPRADVEPIEGLTATCRTGVGPTATGGTGRAGTSGYS